MTGLQSPYDEPINPEITLDTEKSTPQECLEKILAYLKL
jgi:adenylylsulfate kinase